MSQQINITTPVGRLVGGSVGELFQRTDKHGAPKFQKDGVTPSTSCSIGVAIPKGAEKHWAETPWGAQIYQAGFGAFPQGQAQQPTFAWKITDGDSAVPNKVGKKPCDNPGYAGNWVLNMSNGFVPKSCNATGQQAIDPKDIYKGSYVQVFFSVAGNNSIQSPGMYFNPMIVALAAHGEPIVTGPDMGAAGFGQGVQLPPGASAAPLAQNFAAQVPAAPAPAPAPQAYAPPAPQPFPPAPAAAPYPQIMVPPGA